uniref:PKD domain-containing protein n=1 Tax=candidate division WOR-3 bacterium TaxID=2052148 RepID=A0A7V3VUP4_UNCW3
MKNIIFISLSFVILSGNCAKVNSPPNIPSKPSGPQYGFNDSTCIFSTSTTDPDQDDVAIRFYFGDGDTSHWSSYIKSGDTCTISHIFIDTGRYYISAQAKDVNGNYSNWSSAHSIRILLAGANNYPEPPSPPSGPSLGKPDSLYMFSSSAFDPDGDSISIRFCWGNGDTSEWSNFVANNQIVTDSHSWNSTGTYYIKAQAKDIYGALSPWSGIKVVNIVLNYPPNTPSKPIGPNSGYANIIYTFKSSGTDPENDSIAIRFSWGDGNTSDWSPYIRSGDTTSMAHSWENPGSYTIRGQAKDTKGAISDWSDGHQILISQLPNNPPNKPSTPSGPSIGFEESTYVFSSIAIDPDNDSVAIRFAWGDGDTSAWSNYFPGGDSIRASHSWSLRGIYYITAQAKDKWGAVSEWSDSAEIYIRP